MPEERIFYLPKKDNWWGPAGETGPCGPDTEMFYDTGKNACSPECRPGCSCGKYFEVWNDVFMQYNKTADGTYELLKQKNVDTGMGVERTVAVLNGYKSVYDIDILRPIAYKVRQIAGIDNPDDRQEKSIRIIVDHIIASTYLIAEQVVPSNVDRGYVLRRLLRRAIRHGKILGIEREFLTDVMETVVDIHKSDYPHLEQNKKFIFDEARKEEMRFRSTINRGLRQFEVMARNARKIDGKNAFLLFQSFGFPIEVSRELAAEKGIEIDLEGFEEEFKRHQETSRRGAEKRFKGGLADTAEETTKLHTATHLLNESLRRVLRDKGIVQRGSNITAERLRFDFNFDRKMTDKEIEEVENLVNEQIREGLPVTREEVTVEEAKRRGAQAVFEHKYGDSVSVYSIGKFSIEICGGPHVKNTKELGKFEITKEEAVAAGTRRIKAKLV